MKCPHCEGTGELIGDQVTFGAMVLAHRKSAGLTQQMLAAKAAISRGQLANIETDRTDVPMKTASRIAEGLGCTLKDLMP